MTTEPAEQREQRWTQARTAIETGLRDRLDTWYQTPPRLDWAADAAMDALGDLAAEILVDGTMLRSLTIRDGVATLELEEATEMVRIFAAGMRGVLDGHGASNYVEMEMVDGATGDAYTVTVRHRERPTPHQFRQQAEARVAELEQQLADCQARQLLGTTSDDTADEEREPIQLRWGLDDVMYGDDDTTTVLLSGPGREPYWVELDPERTATLRAALAGPESAPTPVPVDRAAILRERADFYDQWLRDSTSPDSDPRYCQAVHDIALGLRRLAGEAAAGAHHPDEVRPPGGFATRVCRNCSRTITWVPGGTWTHEPHNPDGGHIAAPYSLPAECHVTPAVPAAPEETR